jgi:hypothetical protein
MSAFGLASGVSPPEGPCARHGTQNPASEHSKKADDKDRLAKDTDPLGKGTASAVPLSTVKKVGFSP